MKFAAYNVIQVVRNHECHEPVTIGVLVHDNKDAELRLIGSMDSTYKMGKGEFGYAFTDLVDADLIYIQWLEWFERKTKEMKVDSNRVLDKLAKLQERGETIIATVTGKIPFPHTGTISTIADQLFEELVMVNPVMKMAKFRAAVDEFLTRSEIRFFDGFIEDAEVELLGPNNETQQLLYFPLLWDSLNRGRYAAMLVSANDSPRQISASVSNVMNAFEIAQNYKYIAKEYCFVLIDNKLSEYYETLLSKVAEVIYIDREFSGHRKIRRMFYKQSI